MKSIFTLFLLISSVFAHPHTFIEVYPSIEVEKSKFSTIHFKWVLDEMTSTILIMELDSNANGKIDKKENDYIEKEYFSMFKPYSYYTYVKIDKKVVPFKPENFKATIENHRLCYSFDIYGNYGIKNTIFEFGDSDFYVAMVLKDEFVTIKGSSAKVSGVDNDFYYGYKLEFK
ncbi:MAG: DUF1007 family protein [Sulfurimonas sp.]|nr:DUF1007 family protein [Sulfurimonas sp.]